MKKTSACFDRYGPSSETTNTSKKIFYNCDIHMSATFSQTSSVCALPLMSETKFHTHTKPQKIIVYIYIKFEYWGLNSNCVHSARRSQIGLLYLPRVIIRMENLVELRLAEETKYSEKTCPSATMSTVNPTLPERARTRATAVGSQ
jgi:hypothetical protein